MKVLINTGGVAMTNCFLVADEIARQAVLFDAPDHTVQPLLEEAAKNGWEIIGLWLTHGHFDHFADHQVWRQSCPNGRSLLHPLDAPKAFRADVQTRMFGLPFEIPPFKPDAYLSDGQELGIGSLVVTVIHTPGHSPGHVCFHIASEKLLIGGDLIIGGSVGRTDLPDSKAADLQTSIQRIMELPGETTLLGGHGPATTLASERDQNQFVRFALRLD